LSSKEHLTLEYNSTTAQLNTRAQLIKIPIIPIIAALSLAQLQLLSMGPKMGVLTLVVKRDFAGRVLKVASQEASKDST